MNPCSQIARRGPLLASLSVLAMVLVADVAEAATPVESAAELNGLCDLATPQPPDGVEQLAAYHLQRRQAVHQVYETRLAGLEDAMLDYDRVSGLLTISGFRRYKAYTGAPEIRLRNECILSFEFSEEQAHDLMTQVRLGTVELEIGFLVAAHTDYDQTYCQTDEQGNRELLVDLLYARLVDVERLDDEAWLGHYQTPIGLQWALRQSTLAIDQARMSVPEVAISHLQWRPRGLSWQADLEDETTLAVLSEVEPELQAAIERSLYPCYVLALGRNASLQGALVLEVPLVDGELGGPRFLMDTLDDKAVRKCVRERLERTHVQELLVEADGVDAFKATILMRRR